MFWNKKKKEEDGKKKMFEVPEGNRGAFRCYPSDDAPILIKIKGGKTSKAVDICAGGISFPDDNYENGTTYDCKIKLTRDIEPFAAKVIIHKIDDKNICRCSMVDLTDEQDDLVHHYVLERQKEELEEKKKGQL
ncbi:uncharacterized protein METZ01_LOCUS405229 [marine metagenome]|uniref:PilZ domain-containing protein n=1 Tax=marine metagenome TaxID=408172 RepID=A0A382W272_9ZZZZ